MRKLFDKSVALPAANEYAPDFSLNSLNMDSYKQFIVDVLGLLIKKHDMPNDELKYYLPEFWPTNLVLTSNVRELRHILKLRAAPAALKEFRDLARAMYEAVPEQFKYLLEGCVHDETNNDTH